VDQAAPPFAVNSSFNGAGLYRMGALLGGPSNASGCRYRGTRNSMNCEHVPYHLCLRKHGLRLGVLPSLVASCGHPKVYMPPRPGPWNKVSDMDGNGSVCIHNLSAPCSTAGSTSEVHAEQPRAEEGTAAGHHHHQRQTALAVGSLPAAEESSPQTEAYAIMFYAYTTASPATAGLRVILHTIRRHDTVRAIVVLRLEDEKEADERSGEQARLEALLRPHGARIVRVPRLLLDPTHHPDCTRHLNAWAHPGTKLNSSFKRTPRWWMEHGAEALPLGLRSVFSVFNAWRARVSNSRRERRRRAERSTRPCVCAGGWSTSRASCTSRRTK
jgi:hypothetical protein